PRRLGGNVAVRDAVPRDGGGGACFQRGHRCSSFAASTQLPDSSVVSRRPRGTEIVVCGSWTSAGPGSHVPGGGGPSYTAVSVQSSSPGQKTARDLAGAMPVPTPVP